MSPSPRATAAAVCTTAALALVAATPAAAVRTLQGLGAPADDVTGPVVAVLSLVAWTLSGWLLATCLLSLATRLPGLAGRAAARVVRRLAPVAVRRTIEVALGLTVTAGTLGAGATVASAGGLPASPAAASSAPPATSLAPPVVGGAPPSLDWAGARAERPRPAGPVRPAEPVTSPTVLGAPVPGAEQPVVVRPGDTLWGLAERALERHTGVRPGDRDIAAAWPTWWAANRAVVGDDPDLLLPGTTLTAPATGPPAPSPPGEG